MTQPPFTFLAEFAAPHEVSADWLAIGVWEDDPSPSSEPTEPLDQLVARLRSSGDLTGKRLELLPLYTPTDVKAARVLFVGLGKKADATRLTLHEAAAASAHLGTTKQFQNLAFVLPAITGMSSGEVALAIGVGLAHGSDGPGLRKSAPSRFRPHRLTLVLPPGLEPISDQAIDRVRAEAHAVALARELVNTPACDLYPETFATIALDTGRLAGFEVEVWDEQRLAAERMGAIMGVARGSDRPPRLVVMRYTGNPGGPTLGLVGKGVTFDSGGLSLKTSEQMVDMKCDMAGAAAVLGGLKAIAELKIRVNVLGVLALVENMPGGKALKLGDVLTARNGKTIEVLNTDAEGRLILADALSYAAEQNVAHLVDFATLTGACMIALGPNVAGLMTNNDPWGDRVLAAVSRAGERAWKLPMDSHYDEMIRSKVADMRNTGGSRYAGAISAAKLLQQFIGGVPWVHLDIAGPSWAESESAAQDPGGTGCMVRSIVELAGGYQ